MLLSSFPRALLGCTFKVPAGWPGVTLPASQVETEPRGENLLGQSFLGLPLPSWTKRDVPLGCLSSCLEGTNPKQLFIQQSPKTVFTAEGPQL